MKNIISLITIILIIGCKKTDEVNHVPIIAGQIESVDNVVNLDTIQLYPFSNILIKKYFTDSIAIDFFNDNSVDLIIGFSIEYKDSGVISYNSSGLIIDIKPSIYRYSWARALNSTELAITQNDLFVNHFRKFETIDKNSKWNNRKQYLISTKSDGIISPYCAEWDNQEYENYIGFRFFNNSDNKFVYGWIEVNPEKGQNIKIVRLVTKN